MKRAATVCVVMAVTLAAAATVGADVPYKRIKTEVKVDGAVVNGSEVTFSGKLKSRKPACVKRRRGLYVHHLEDGVVQGAVGNDRTDRKGNWEFTRSTAGLENGDYDATIRAAVVFKSGEKKFKCRGDRTTFVVDDL